MKDKDKTKEQLINELVEMRQRITELKTSEAELIRTEEELREAHKELEQTEQYLERLIESSPDAIVSTDREGAVTFFSLGAETLLGYEQEEIIGQRVTLLYENEDRAKEVMRQMRESGGTVAGFETLLRAKDGSLIPALISASILYDEDGHEAGTVGFNKDLRERKRAEEALRESEEQYRRLVETMNDGFAVLDENHVVTYVNRKLCEMFGYSREEMIGEPASHFLDEANQKLFREQLARRRKGEREPYEIEWTRKDGRKFFARAAPEPIFDKDGRFQGSFGVVTDITERKRAEEALRQAEEKYRSIFEYAIEGIFQTTPDGKYISANPSLARIYGYESPEELIRGLTDISRQLYVDPSRRAEFSRLLQEDDTVSAFESQIYLKDGSVIWISENARAVRDPSGELLYYEGSVEDITERKRTEEALREWASFAESNPAPVLRFGPDGKVTHANPAAYHIFGEGKLESRLIGEILPPISKINIGEYVRNGRVDTCDLTIGERSFQFVIMGVSDLGVGHIYGSDITERKRAEETMRLANERMRQQLETARIIQQSFLPGHLPGIDDPRYSLAAANYPAAAVGGDYYDVIQIGPNCLGLVLGDVSGKGVPGAIYMARLVSDFRFLVEPHDDSPAETLTALNRLLQDRGQPGMFVTLLYLTLDLDTGAVTFANAGHLPLLIRRAIGKVEAVVGDAGPPLGVIDNIAYNDSFLSLQPGEDMLLYTDGVTEAMNSAREQFTEERLLEILLRTHPRPENLVNTVTEEVQAFTGDVTPNDDLTLLAARWEGKNPRML